MFIKVSEDNVQQTLLRKLKEKSWTESKYL